MVPNMVITNNLNFDPLGKIIGKSKNHPSITCINERMANSEITLYFSPKIRLVK